MGEADEALRRAMEAGDVEAVVAAFTPDAVLHSPLTDGLAFVGSDQIRAVVEVLLAVVSGLRYTAQLAGEAEAFLVAGARVGSQDIEMIEHLLVAGDGRIREMTVFF